MEKEIEKTVQTLIADNFKINATRSDDLFLLGLMPRDLVKVVCLVENEYNIQFSESELVQNKFNTIANIVSVINQHIRG